MTVEKQLQAIVARLRKILGENLLGIYLHGSLALGCFNLEKSDLDLLVLSRAPLTPRSRYTVTKTLLALSGSPAPVEISVIRMSDLHPWRHPCPYDFHYSEDWRARYEQLLSPSPASDPDLAAHITVLRARGQALYGPPSAEVFPEIPRADFLDSILGDVFSPQFGLTVETEIPVYMVLNACRTLAYLKTGRIFSKDEGGVWALENIPAALRGTIQVALESYRGANQGPGVEKESLAGFVKWMKREIRQKASHPPQM